MALSFFKSPNEEPWDQFSHRMNRALEAASVELKQKHQRRLQLGSPVKMPGDPADVVRVPIEVRGGAHQYAIAYLDIDALGGRTDQRKLEAIAMDAVQAALPYAQTPPAKPGSILFRYP
ncbi:MAG: hypothetical protein AB7R89_00475 [Dehalococcoidia bacterium]